MYFYLKGKVIKVFSNKIILEVNNIGYEIVVVRSSSYLINEERTVYIYEHNSENSNYLVGFDSLEEKKMFNLLIEVNGLGPKTAINIMQNACIEEIYNAILCNNATFFKKIPGVGIKCASQIILDLNSKLCGKKVSKNYNKEVVLALKELGFKNAAIENALASINNPDLSDEELLVLALRKLRPQNG